MEGEICVELEIRAMREADFDAVQEIFRGVHALHQQNRPDIFRKLDAPLSYEYYMDMCKNPDGIALCAVCGGRIAGVSYTYIKKPNANPVALPRITAFMDDLAVHPDFRGQGVGKALFMENQKRAAERGAVSLELMVWAFNQNAVEFYGHAGMTPRSIMEMPLQTD